MLAPAKELGERRQLGLTGLVVRWPTRSAICPMVTPFSLMIDTNECRSSRGVQAHGAIEVGGAGGLGLMADLIRSRALSKFCASGSVTA